METGAIMTIIHPKVTKKRKLISKTKWSVRRATGESANVREGTVANLNTGDTFSSIAYW